MVRKLRWNRIAKWCTLPVIVAILVGDGIVDGGYNLATAAAFGFVYAFVAFMIEVVAAVIWDTRSEIVDIFFEGV